MVNYLMVSLGIVRPVDIFVGGIVYLLVTISALYLIMKNEKSYLLFLWVLFSIFIPVIGGGVYIVKFLLTKK